MELSKEESLKLVDKYFDEFKDLLKNLVSYPSVLEEYKENSLEPFGKANKEVLDYILAYAKKDGFETLNQDNYAGHILFGNEGEDLGILSHLDVVPVEGQRWTSNPFEMVERDGKLIGRGVNDDKGPLAASYIAIKILKDLGFSPKKRIKLIMGCDEESGSRCLEHYFKYNPMPKIGFSPDACFPCINGEKAGAHFDMVGSLENDSIISSILAGNRYNIVPGEARMTLKKNYKNEYLDFLKKNNFQGEINGDEYIAYGLSAHAMCPEKGINAAVILFKFLRTITNEEIVEFVNIYVADDPYGKKMGIDISCGEMGTLSLNLGIVKIIDNKVFLGFDSRVPSDEHRNVIEKRLKEISKEYKNIHFDNFNMGTVHYVESSSKLVSTLVNAYQAITGDSVNKAYTIGGGTYAKFIDSAVAFGPQFVGGEDVDHQADEYINIKDYKKVIAIYLLAIYELTK